MKEHRARLTVKQAFPDTLKGFETAFALHNRAEHGCAYIRATRDLAAVANYSPPAARFSVSLPERKVTVHDIALVSVGGVPYQYYRDACLLMLSEQQSL